MRYSSGSQSVVLRPAASASNENLLEMQIHWSHPNPVESEILGVKTQQNLF